MKEKKERLYEKVTLLISGQETIINVTVCTCATCRGQVELMWKLDWSDVGEFWPSPSYLT